MEFLWSLSAGFGGEKEETKLQMTEFGMSLIILNLPSFLASAHQPELSSCLPHRSKLASVGSMGPGLGRNSMAGSLGRALLHSPACAGGWFGVGTVVCFPFGWRL